MMMFEEDDMMNGDGGMEGGMPPAAPEAPAEGDMGGESTDPNTGM